MVGQDPDPHSKISESRFASKWYQAHIKKADLEIVRGPGCRYPGPACRDAPQKDNSWPPGWRGRRGPHASGWSSGPTGLRGCSWPLYTHTARVYCHHTANTSKKHDFMQSYSCGVEGAKLFGWSHSRTVELIKRYRNTVEKRHEGRGI